MTCKPLICIMYHPDFIVSNQKKESISAQRVKIFAFLIPDVGYSLNNDPGYLIDVLNTYFNVYFPRAAEIASQLKNLAYVERLVYTTHPWLLKMYLDCPPNLVLSGRKLKV